MISILFISDVEMLTGEIEVLLDTLKRLRDEIDSVIETLEILMDKDLMEGIKKAEEDFKKGNVFTHEEIKKKHGL